MKKALIATAVALAFPAAASAHHHHHHHALYARLSGTGTLASAHGTIASRKLGSGTFTSAVTTTGAATILAPSARNGDRGTLSCAPATDALTLVGSSTVSLTLTGKSCTWTPAGSTTSTSAFFGHTSNAKAFLVAKSDGTVRGAVFMGVDRRLFTQFSAREHDAAEHSGDCDH